MKKSFKKAGAAVLSMAMLLAMGSVSMPVYAAPTDAAGTGSDNEYKPGQVNVTINPGSSDPGYKWADDGATADGDKKNHQYSYLDDATQATVKIYKVAELTSNGWEWLTDFASVEDDNPSLAGMIGLDEDANNPLDVSSFRDLLKTITDANGKEIPLATSTQLQSLASKLERIINNANTDNNNANDIVALDSATISKNSDGTFGTAHLVADDSAYMDEVRNKIGYYLVVTSTDDATVTVQPSLVVLQNKKGEAAIVDMSVKGENIEIDKKIVSILDMDVGADGTSTGGNVVGAEGNTGIVAENDTITYQIAAEVPTYDPLLDPAQINSFVIIDTPDKGINVLDSSNAPQIVKVEVSDMNGATVDITDLAGTAYTIEGLPYGYNPGSGSYDPGTGAAYGGQQTGTVPGEGGFRIIFTGEQLRKYGPEYVAADSTANPPVAEDFATMEGATVLVTFTATIDEEFKRTGAVGTPHKTYSELAIAQLAGTNPAFTMPSEDDLKVLAEPAGTLNDSDYEAYIATLSMTADDKAAIDAIEGFSTTYQNATNEGYLRAYLALKALNDAIDVDNEAALADNGNVNKADMRFGNDYATGKGNGNDEDTTKVFSVDLDLTKVVEDNLIVPQMSDGSEVADSEGNTNYTDERATKPVAGAVFKLTKLFDGGSKVIGYAITDANGKLVLAEDVSAVDLTGSEMTMPDSGYAEIHYNSATGEQLLYGSAAYLGTSSAGAITPETKRAWIELTLGSYTLEEVYAPAGYKKWSGSGITFTVTSDKDGNGNYIGVFGATTTATDRAMEEADTTGNTYKIVEDKTFTFNATSGNLENTIFNNYDDKLPATGGIGTVLFTAGGISIVLIAGALFVMYMKKRNAEDEE